MQRFTFRLENLLRVRKKNEERAQREFSVRKAQLLRLEAQMGEVRSTLSSFYRSIPWGDGESFTAMEAVAVDNYIHRLRRTLMELDEARARKALEVDRFLQLLVEARKARKVIEVLRDRQWNRYLEDVQREERVLLDDVSRNIAANGERLSIGGLRFEEARSEELGCEEL